MKIELRNIRRSGTAFISRPPLHSTYYVRSGNSLTLGPVLKMKRNEGSSRRSLILVNCKAILIHFISEAFVYFRLPSKRIGLCILTKYIDFSDSPWHYIRWIN